MPFTLTRYFRSLIGIVTYATEAAQDEKLLVLVVSLLPSQAWEVGVSPTDSLISLMWRVIAIRRAIVCASRIANPKSAVLISGH